MIQKLRKKFVMITMSLITVILVAVLAGICLFFAQSARQQSNRSLEMALSHPFDQPSPKFQVGAPRPDNFRRDPVFVASVGADGQAGLVSAERVEISPENLQAIVTGVLQKGAQQGDLPSYNLRYLVKNTAGETLIAFVDLTEEKTLVRNMALTCLGVGVLALAAFFAASLVLARWALKPAEEAWARQRRFVSDASHELKTPLTVILANTEILKAHPAQTVAAQMNWVENTGQEARRMKTLVEDMLFLAQNDDMDSPVTLEMVNLSDAVSGTTLLFEAVAFEQGLRIEADVQPDIWVLGHEGRLKQLVGILLDNAVKYARPQSDVTLTLVKHHGCARLSVHNEGQTISPEALRHVFERFYRADPSRAKEGYGLGLSIAQTIAETHRGKITVESSEAEGTVFRVSLPLAP